MNPTGLRLEEKKSADEVRSQTSYKSTQSSRSSVLQRAREYNRRIEDQRRSKSLERSPGSAAGSATDGADNHTPRSKSVGRVTRERALDTVQRDSNRLSMERQQRQAPPAAAPQDASARRSSPVVQRQQQRQSFASQQRSSPRQPREPSVGTRSVGTARSARSAKDSPSRKSSRHQADEENPNNIVTPELLVDALSGHEDGLLAIAEKLMEHYDAGYDVMGEAIIDAFADVQKLFQHVVEAAHMEGAAFEASRRESEQQQQQQEHDVPPATGAAATPSSGPTRHDEFIDQDVKDILTNAIRKGTSLRDANRHDACYELFEQACQAASSLLPVDSDHRGRLQLSAARAESMSPDRACAILRYAMDDVLRSGMRAGRMPLPDPSQRADVVLSRPKGHPSLSGVTGQVSGVVQSSDEALASLMEEMKEILSAPVYKDTPLQGVARRFWAALNDAQKTQQKNEERLEQNLGKLKGEFLLARAVRHF